MSIACKVLLRLGAIVDETLATEATQQLEGLAPAALENPFGFGQTLGVLDRMVRGSVDIVIAGRRGDDRTLALATTAFKRYLPNRNIVWLDEDDSRASCPAIAEGKVAGSAGEPQAYVCRGRTCSLPVRTPEALEKLLSL